MDIIIPQLSQLPAIGLNQVIVTSLMFDMRVLMKNWGAACARILTFDVTKGTVFVQTYAVYANQFYLTAITTLL
jgi:hypothetical protein